MITKETQLKKILELAPPCDCSKCKHGCTMGSGFLSDNDLDNIAKFLNISMSQLQAKYLEETTILARKILRPKIIKTKHYPYGRCIFFKNGCLIHPVKPLECKIAMGCKEYGEDLTLWFMLNHILDPENPESVREYASYLKSGGKTLKGGKLRDIIPNAKQLKQILQYRI